MDTLPCFTPHVLAMPYPGRGHINPMLILSRQLASHGILITFVVTEEWLALLSATTPLNLPPNLRLRTIPNIIPSEVGRAKDFAGFLDAVATKMEEPVEKLIDQLQPPVTAVLADTYLSWAVAVAGRRGARFCSLFTMSATFFAGLHHLEKVGERDGTVACGSGEVVEPLKQQTPCLTSAQLADMKSLSSLPSMKRALESMYFVGKADCVLFTSFYELESRVIDALRATLSCPVYPVGPSIPYMMLQENPCKSLQSNGSKTDYFNWLDSQPTNSVLYVSLGSFLSVSGPQMVEIAMGLQASGTRFLWIARENCSEMQEMSGCMGLVVPWCNQLKVLNHPSIGGFFTHCGWNSTLEGVFSGVPMLTLPIFWDQIVDSRLIVDHWKIGLSLKEEAESKDFVRQHEIAAIVTRFMNLEEDESKELRRRSIALREASCQAVKGGGSSVSNIDCLVKDLMQRPDC